MWQNIISCINTHQRFIISGHVNPDCDSLGSALGLGRFLLDAGKTVNLLNNDPTPENYQFLDPAGLIQAYQAETHAPILASTDVVIVVDASSGWDRLGGLGEAMSQLNARTICIDHHTNQAPFAEIMVVDSSRIATGELIFDLIQTMGGSITQAIAEALYAAIYTDSGGFRYPKTSAVTHRIIAQLLETGLDHSRVYHHIYERQSHAEVLFRGYVLNNLHLTAQGQIAYIALTQAVMQEYGVDMDSLAGLSGTGREIDGVRVSLLGIEEPDGKIKLSLRSDGSVSVNEVAAHFGGGGHVPAAGATTAGDFEAVLQQTIALIKAQL